MDVCSRSLISKKHSNAYRNVPVGFVVVLLVSTCVRLDVSRSETRQRCFKDKIADFDFIGSILIVGCIVCLFLALQWGGQAYAWDSSTIIGLFVGFAALGCMLIFIQWHLKEKATIPPRIFKQRTVLSSCFYLFFCYMNGYTVRIQ